MLMSPNGNIDAIIQEQIFKSKTKCWYSISNECCHFLTGFVIIVTAIPVPKQIINIRMKFATITMKIISHWSMTKSNDPRP